MSFSNICADAQEPVERFHERIEKRVVDACFAETQVPCRVVDQVRAIYRQYGLYPALAAAVAVLDAFQAGADWQK